MFNRTSKNDNSSCKPHSLGWHSLIHLEYYRRFGDFDDINDAARHYSEVGYKKGLFPNPLFNTNFYLSKNPDVREARINPLEHFFSSGAAEGRDPHPFFSNSFYTSQISVCNETVPNALLHYFDAPVESARSPHPLFDTQWYLSNLNGYVPKVPLLVDFIESENESPPSPHPLIRTDFVHRQLENDTTLMDALIGFASSREDMLTISPHPLFNSDWYLDTYIDIRKALIHPLLHYISIGHIEGRNPNPFFDNQWYRKKYLPALEDHGDTLSHYIKYGKNDGHSPSPMFDAEWYRHEYLGGSQNQIEPLEHFFAVGIDEGLKPRRSLKNKNWGDKTFRSIPIENDCLVSVIIINYNGLNFLPGVLSDLSKQTYSNFEIIIVDNASTDGSLTYLKQCNFAIRLIESPENLGFAGGNNLGYRYARGEVIVLLNNDVEVASDWLSSLVTQLVVHPESAAACSRIRLLKKFVDLELQAISGERDIDIQGFIETLSYPKILPQIPNKLSSRMTVGPDSSLILRVPVQRNYIVPTFGVGRVNASILGTDLDCWVDLDHESLKITLSDDQMSTARWVLNNTGSVEDPTGQPFDRGFGEYDSNQYSNIEHVPLICGCAVAIKRGALKNEQLFFDEFFAYYEDSELSKRLTRRNHSLVYVPDSIVYHYHSATSVENSGTWRTLTFRNKAIYNILQSHESNVLDIAQSFIHEAIHLQNYYNTNDSSAAETEFADNVPNIIDRINNVAKLRLSNASYVRRTTKRIGVYNTYWETRGGGEAHALMVAKALEEFGEVDLISEASFDPRKLSEFFNVDTSRMHFRKIAEMYNALSAEYDIFVNATFLSQHVSHAPQSFYLVSFPQTNGSPDFLQSYRFLANSKFTESWCKRYWGSLANTDVLYPAVRTGLIQPSAERSKTVLSIGRFNPDGHDKNQLEMVRCWREMYDRGYLATGWELVLIGSLDQSNPVCTEHFRVIKQAAEGLPIRLLPDTPHEELLKEIRKAAIYWHITGLGKDVDTTPELFEHFGMTVAEAAVNGCIPVVLDAAGPKEIVEHLNFGETIETSTDLIAVTSKLISDFEAGAHCSKPPTVGPFSEDTQRDKLRSLLADTEVPSYRPD